ncbi:unnamed protein product [Trichobilharzia regenti]|nr:unnamed protein product [Trichobilharzia regenti]
MMDAYNLAICFGPTLMPVPSEYNQVHYQPSVIDLIKTFIIHHSAIFDPILPGPVYSKQKRKKDVHKSVTSLDSHRLSLSSSNVVEISSDINGNKKKNKENDDHDHDLLRSSSVKKNSRITSRTPIESAVKRQSSTRVDSQIWKWNRIGDKVVNYVHYCDKWSPKCSVSDLIDNETSSKPASQVIDEGEPVGDDDYIFAEDTQSISDSEESNANSRGMEPENERIQGKESIPPQIVVPVDVHYNSTASPPSSKKHLPTEHFSANDVNFLIESDCTMLSLSLQLIRLGRNSEPAYTLAVARADFTGSSERELSFRQGDEIYLYRQLSQHWWEGQLASDSQGTRGLIPHLYVVPKAALLHLAAAAAAAAATASTTCDNPDMKSDNCSDNQISVPQTTESVDKKCLPEVGGYTDKLLMMHRFNQRSALSYPVCGPLGSVPENDVISASELMNQSSPTYNSNGVVGGGGRPSHSVVESGSSTRFLFNSDVDTALEEVMRGLASLEQADSRNSDSRTLERNQELTRKLCLPSAKHAPDLVMDLPVTSDSQVQNNTSTTSGFTHIESGDSFAEHFAEQNLDTMRKRSDVHVLPSSLASTRFPTGSSSTTSCGELGKVVLRSKTSHTTTPATTTEISRTSPGLSKGSPSEEKSDSPQTSNTELTSSSGPRLSIAARVAAFEGNKPDSPRSSINFAPKIAPKPKRG